MDTYDPRIAANHPARLQRSRVAGGRGCFRTLKSTLAPRPVYHHPGVLCWPALLLARVCEEKTGGTWDHLRRVMQCLEVVTSRCSAGEGLRCTEVTSEQKAILPALGIPAPPPAWGQHSAGDTALAAVS